ncbi:hypothetical protein ACJX0J_036032 [Zea mays]
MHSWIALNSISPAIVEKATEDASDNPSIIASKTYFNFSHPMIAQRLDPDSRNLWCFLDPPCLRMLLLYYYEMMLLTCHGAEHLSKRLIDDGHETRLFAYIYNKSGSVGICEDQEQI